jgi:hypothetical protein
MKIIVFSLLLLVCVFTLNSCGKEKKISGCTDWAATNYNSEASEDDGSCTYSPDLPGTWQMHSLVASSSNLLSWSGWTHGLLTIDSTHHGTFSSVVRSDGSNFSSDAFVLSISSSGVIMVSGQNTFHGFMSADKRAMNITMTDGGGGYCLAVVQKEVSGTNYSTADLQGTWQMHSLVASSSNLSSWSGWTHGLLTIDASGHGTFSSVVKSPGGNTSIDAVVLSISSSGVITVSGENTFHGFMSADKRAMNITMPDGGGGYCLTVVQKEL